MNNNYFNFIFNKLRTPFVLGDSLIDKLYFLLVVLEVYFRGVFTSFHGFSCGKILRLKFRDKKFVFYVFNGADFGILFDVFIKEEYKLFLRDPKVIVDIGSNSGASVIYFKIIYPNAIIFAVEPDPNTFQQLKMNTESFPFVNLFNQAISAESGEVDFYVYPGSTISSSIYQRLPNQSCIRIKSSQLDDFIELNNIRFIDLIKCDIEGAEFDVFANFTKLNVVGAVLCEIHEDISGKKVDDFHVYFKNFSVVSNKVLSRHRYLVGLKSAS